MISSDFWADLQWALTSPNLLQAVPTGLTGDLVSEASTHQLWQGLTVPTTPPEPARRLGLYFEQLLAYALAHQADCDGLQQNWAVFEQGQQRGALDLVFRQQQQWHHWELAVKFYLYHASEQHWYGPNAQDQLAAKLARLFNHQLPLAQHPQLRARLPVSLQSAALIRGYLFYHWQQADPILPSWLNPQHARGWWCYVDELPDYLDSFPSDYRWCILPRAAWLRPAHAVSHAAALTREALLAQMPLQFAPPLMVALQNQGQTWQEVSRGFVVPANWPQHAQM